LYVNRFVVVAPENRVLKKVDPNKAVFLGQRKSVEATTTMDDSVPADEEEPNEDIDGL
jgi:hypothetical protein